jgi:hypothetical protein
MHIILAALGAAITVLILFNRLKDAGIDIGWLNPFSWAHRRRWRKKFNADPAFLLEKPMEVAAGLMFVAAKCSGEMTQEEKIFILQKFESDFKLTSAQATDLLSSTAFLIKDEDTIFNKVDLFIEPSRNNFSEAQMHSTIELVESVINVNQQPGEKQLSFINKVRNAFFHKDTNKESW